MSYDPNQPNQPQWGSNPDPYGQQPQSSPPYGQQPQSSPPYGQPQSGQPYSTTPLPSNDPYAQPGNADPYGYPSQQQSPPPGQPYGAPGGPGGGFPPPTPPKRNTTPIIIGIVAVTVLVIAVCGISGWLISKSGDDTTANPTTSSSAAAPTTPASASASPESTGPSIDTSRPEIAPAGAPYRWRVPAGFREVTPPKSDSTGSAAKFTSAAAATATEQNDFLIVDSYTLTADADAVTVTALETEFDRLVRSARQDPSTRETSTINGYRALKYQFKYPSSQAYSYFIFKGTNEIQVRCQWADTEAAIKTGCQDLLNSLTIT